MSRRGFTFIEILLVTSLIAVLSLSIFTCLSNGLKLWERSQRVIVAEDVVVFFDRISIDLRNSFLFSTLSWDGGEYDLTFPTVVMTLADGYSSRREEEYIDQLGRVQYRFDTSEGAVYRSQANYSQGVREQWGAPRVVLPYVNEVKFKYYYGPGDDYDLHIGEGEQLPSSIEVEVRVGRGEAERIFSRLITIPLGV